MEQDKRKFPRLSVNVEVNYVVAGEEAPEYFTTASKNLSTGGVCIVVFEKMDTGTLLDLRFSVPELNKFIIAKGRVVWIRELSIQGKTTDAGFEAGIEFVTISEEDRRKIEEFVIAKSA